MGSSWKSKLVSTRKSQLTINNNRHDVSVVAVQLSECVPRVDVSVRQKDSRSVQVVSASVVLVRVIYGCLHLLAVVGGSVDGSALVDVVLSWQVRCSSEPWTGSRGSGRLVVSELCARLPHPGSVRLSFSVRLVLHERDEAVVVDVVASEVLVLQVEVVVDLLHLLDCSRLFVEVVAADGVGNGQLVGERTGRVSGVLDDLHVRRVDGLPEVLERLVVHLDVLAQTGNKNKLNGLWLN